MNPGTSVIDARSTEPNVMQRLYQCEHAVLVTHAITVISNGLTNPNTTVRPEGQRMFVRQQIRVIVAHLLQYGYIVYRVKQDTISAVHPINISLQLTQTVMGEQDDPAGKRSSCGRYFILDKTLTEKAMAECTYIIYVLSEPDFTPDGHMIAPNSQGMLAQQCVIQYELRVGNDIERDTTNSHRVFYTHKRTDADNNFSDVVDGELTMGQFDTTPVENVYRSFKNDVALSNYDASLQNTSDMEKLSFVNEQAVPLPARVRPPDFMTQLATIARTAGQIYGLPSSKIAGFIPAKIGGTSEREKAENTVWSALLSTWRGICSEVLSRLGITVQMGTHVNINNLPDVLQVANSDVGMRMFADTYGIPVTAIDPDKFTKYVDRIHLPQGSFSHSVSSTRDHSNDVSDEARELHKKTDDEP